MFTITFSARFYPHYFVFLFLHAYTHLAITHYFYGCCYVCLTSLHSAMASCSIFVLLYFLRKIMIVLRVGRVVLPSSHYRGRSYGTSEALR
jgi:hypothetical protein